MAWKHDSDRQIMYDATRYDRDWKKIEAYVGTKTVIQVRATWNGKMPSAIRWKGRKNPSRMTMADLHPIFSPGNSPYVDTQPCTETLSEGHEEQDGRARPPSTAEKEICESIPPQSTRSGPEHRKIHRIKGSRCQLHCTDDDPGTICCTILEDL